MILTTYQQFRLFVATTSDLYPDGLPEFPSADVDTAGFRDTLVFPALVSSPYLIEVYGATSDLPSGTDQYDWYLSQRTDDPARQYFLVQRNDDGEGVTNSGRIQLVTTTLATTLYPTLTDTATLIALFTDLDLYVRRRSDGLIQHRELMDVIFAGEEQA
jgi:hypothetical protein